MKRWLTNDAPLKSADSSDAEDLTDEDDIRALEELLERIVALEDAVAELKLASSALSGLNELGCDLKLTLQPTTNQPSESPPSTTTGNSTLID